MHQTLEQALDAIPESTAGERLFAIGCCLIIIGLPLWHGVKIAFFGI